MKRIFLLALLAMLCISVYAGTPPPKHKSTGGSAIVNKSADSIGFVFSGDTLWFVQNALGWHTDTMLSRPTLDSIVKAVGRFSGSGSGAFVSTDSQATWIPSDTGLYLVVDDDTTFFKSQNTVLVFEDEVLFLKEGMTQADSLTVLGRVIFHTASDSIVFPQSNPTDNYILVYDAAGDSLGWEAQSGGSGTTDSFYVADTNVSVYNNWITPEDTLFRDTTQYLAIEDTSGLWTIDSFYVHDSTANSSQGWKQSGDTLHQDSTQYLAIQDTSGLYAPQLPDSTEIDSANVREWVADKTGGMVTGNTEAGIAVTYDDADNTLDFTVQGVTSGMILNQTLTGADVDSTAQNFVFDDAFKGTSAIADSVLITRRELDDSLDAVRSENAALFQPIGHGDADSLKGVPIPNTPTTGDDQKALTYFETGDTLGWVASTGMAASAFDDSARGNGYIDSLVEAADNDTLNITSLTISGELGVTGDIWNLNYGNLLNLSLANASYPAAPLLDLQAVDSAGVDLDSSWVVHPSNLYAPDGLLWDKTKKKIMAYTPLESEEDENPHLVWAEAGTDNWLPIYNGTDTLKNPIFEPSDFTASTHISDPDILFDFNEDLWMIFRVTYGSDSEVIKICMLDTTAGGVPQMTTPVSILASNGSYLSPSIIRDTNQTYTIFLVEPNTTGGIDSSRVLRYINDGTKLDSTGGWSFKDTCDFPYAGTDRPWHIEVIPKGADELLALVVGDPTNDLASLADTTSLYLATSYDRGATWAYDSTTPTRLLSYEDDTSAYYGRIMYRSSGTWVDDGSGGYLDLYVSAKGPFHSSTNWYIFHTKLFFNNANIAATITQVIDTSWQPQDTGFSATLATIGDVVDSVKNFQDTLHIIPLFLAGGNVDGKTDSLKLFGPAFFGDTTVIAYNINSTGGTDNDIDTVMLVGMLNQPIGYTDSCVHLILQYSTSSTTNTTSMVDSLRVFVDNTSRGSSATDRVSTGTAGTIMLDTIAINTPNYTRGSKVHVKLSTFLDGGQWFRVYKAYLEIAKTDAQ